MDRKTVELLMRRAQLTGVTGRPKQVRGVRPEATAGDLVDRQFERTGPNQLWVTDIERHEALSNRVEVGDLHRRAVAAVWL